MHKQQVALSENEISKLRTMVLDLGLNKTATLVEVSRQTVASLIAALPCTKATVRAVKARLMELHALDVDGGTND